MNEWIYTAHRHHIKIEEHKFDNCEDMISHYKNNIQAYEADGQCFVQIFHNGRALDFNENLDLKWPRVEEEQK